MPVKKLKHINLFAGFGGMAYGLEMANENIQTLLMYEPSAVSRSVLERYFEAEVVADNNQLTEGITKYVGTKRIDILSTRWTNLRSWAISLQAIAAAKPRIIVIEGVAGMRSNGLGQVLKDLWSLDYDAEGHVIPASTFGTIYKGERFWLIAHSLPNGRKKNGDTSPSQGRLGKQYLTDGLLDEYRTWLERSGFTPSGSIHGESRLLRRDDRLSRRVDSTRVRLLSADVSPIVAGFIGFAVTKIFADKYKAIPLEPGYEQIKCIKKRGAITDNLLALEAAGVEYTTKNCGIHVVIPTKSGKMIDYWPSTDTFIIRNTNIRATGVEGVISAVSEY